MNDGIVQNASDTRLPRPVALVVEAATRGHLLQLFAPFIQVLRIFRVERWGAFGVHIFQIALSTHPLST
ncbi:MAG: hypothetical protein CMD33_10715 [Flavobacteriales bacterium]|nr:hypothetical protein [Flavobacteriales bacterium]